MKKAIDRKITEIRIRWSINLLLERITRVLTVLGVVFILLVLLHRLFALTIWFPLVPALLAGALLVVLGFLVVSCIPSRLHTSLYMDEHLQVRERFSTLLALENKEDAFAQCACTEAEHFLRDIKPGRRFPIRLTPNWWRVLFLWVLGIVLFVSLPVYDLLGVQKKQVQKTALQEQWQTTTESVQQNTAAVKQVAEQLNQPELREMLADMNDVTKAATPEIAQHQTIRKLGDLADRIEQAQTHPQAQAMHQLQQALKQLRPGRGELSRQLQLALARGQFDRAAKLLRTLDKQLRQGDLSAQEQKNLAQQLSQMAQQMQALAQKQNALEEALKKMGLDKELARLDAKQLQEALRNKGLSPQQIQTLLDKQCAAQAAQNQMAALAQAMGSAGAGGGLSSDELAAATSQLDELAHQKQQGQLSEAALAAIDQAIACLGQCQGVGYGPGGKGPFRPGVGYNRSPGSGGPGQGYGAVDTDTEGEFSTKQTRVENTAQGGPAIASWYFQGPQSPGEATRPWQEVLNAGREQAAEAIEENRIPGKYHDSVKQYFGQLESTGVEPQ